MHWSVLGKKLTSHVTAHMTEPRPLLTSKTQRTKEEKVQRSVMRKKTQNVVILKASYVLMQEPTDRSKRLVEKTGFFMVIKNFNEVFFVEETHQTEIISYYFKWQYITMWELLLTTEIQ